MNYKVTVIGTSLDKKSRSQLLARQVKYKLARRRIDVSLIDLRDHSLPPSGNPLSVDDAKVVEMLGHQIQSSSHLVFALAIYNFDVSSAAKNLLELIPTEKLKGKTIAFVCAAGSQNSYMSVMNFANTMMLNARCWIVPRFVFATGADFNGQGGISANISQRLDDLTEEMFYQHQPVERTTQQAAGKPVERIAELA
jgi:NAD(P)H-dependent FMN reductase